VAAHTGTFGEVTGPASTGEARKPWKCTGFRCREQKTPRDPLSDRCLNSSSKGAEGDTSCGMERRYGFVPAYVRLQVALSSGRDIDTWVAAPFEHVPRGGLPGWGHAVTLTLELRANLGQRGPCTDRLARLRWR
jgi:hypothetical protein